MSVLPWNASTPMYDSRVDDGLSLFSDHLQDIQWSMQDNDPLLFGVGEDSTWARFGRLVQYICTHHPFVLGKLVHVHNVVPYNRPLVLCMERAPESEQSGNPLWTGTFEVLAVLEPVHTHSRNIQHHWRNYKHALHKVNETICFPDGEEHHVQFVPDDAWWRTGVLHKFAKYKWLSEIPRIRLEADQRTIHHTFSSNA